MSLEDLKTYNYVPYSQLPSVCIVRSRENRFFPGVRVENASFPLTISSIQSALFNCLSEGHHPKAAYVQDMQRNNIEYWKSEYGLWLYHLEDLDGYEFEDISFSLDPQAVSKKLVQLLDKAQAVHSHFPVSALLETDRGFVSGVNIECSEWSYGLCAERVAISKALSYGINTFKAIYIHTRDGEFSSPCGACRQVLVEHLSGKKAHLYHANKTTSRHFVSDLLPYGFHSSTLGKK